MEDEFWRRKEIHASAKGPAVPTRWQDPRGPGWGGQEPEVAVLGKLVPAHEDQQQDGDWTPGVTKPTSPSPSLLGQEKPPSQPLHPKDEQPALPLLPPSSPQLCLVLGSPQTSPPPADRAAPYPQGPDPAHTAPVL